MLTGSARPVGKAVVLEDRVLAGPAAGYPELMTANGFPKSADATPCAVNSASSMRTDLGDEVLAVRAELRFNLRDRVVTQVPYENGLAMTSYTSRWPGTMVMRTSACAATHAGGLGRRARQPSTALWSSARASPR